MERKKRILLVALPVVCLAAVLTAALAGRRSEPESAPAVATKRRTPLPPGTPAWVAQVPVEAPPPAPVEKVQKAMDEARLKSAYQNYRTSVATGNTTMQNALKPQLIKERAAALRIAEAELAAARTGADRETAERTLRMLKD